LTRIDATSRPCGAKKPDFWPVSKNNTGSLPLCGKPAGNNRTTIDLTVIKKSDYHIASENCD